MTNSARNALLAAVALVLAAFAWWFFREPDLSGGETTTKEASVAASARPGSDDGPRRGSPTRRGFSELPTPRSAPKAAVAGTVFDPSGAPVPGAKVCAFVRSSDVEKPKSTPCATTTADGRYRIEGLFGDEYEISASARGFVPVRYVPESRERSRIRLVAGRDTTGIDLRFTTPGVEIRGVVRDISGGEIEGAELRAGVWSGRARATSVAISDAEGNFSLWAAQGELNVSASAEGYGSESQSGRAPGSTFEIFLTPESVVVGRVVDAASGDPVEGARVHTGTWRNESDAFTDADGRFRLSGLEPGQYKPIASSDDGYGELETSVHLGLGETSEPVTIRLHPAATVTGHLVVREGEETRPCAQGWASMKLVGGDNRHAQGNVGAEGFVVFRAVLPGRYEISAGCRGKLSEDGYGEIEVADEPIEGLVWEVTPGATIRGRVVTDDAELLARVSVRGRTVGGGARSQRGWATDRRVGSDGSFELTGLTAGTYELRVGGRGVPEPEEHLKVEVADGQTVEDVELEILPTATIVGRVVDEQGQPIPRADVRSEGPGQQWGSAPVDDDGRFEITGLRGGEYRVWATVDWGSKMRAPGTNDDDIQGERLTVEAGDQGEVEIVVESRNDALSGRVVDESGSPVVDAFVRAERESDSAAANAARGRSNARWGGWSEQPHMTDEDGYFTLEGLSEGDYTIRAWRRGGGEGFAEHVKSDSNGVVVEIAATGRIEGRVTSPSGGEPARFRVLAQDDESGALRSDSFFQTDGRFVLDEMPAGKYRVSVTSSDGTGEAEVTLAEGGVETGVLIELERLVTVRGKIVDLESGEPVPGISVSMSRRKSGGFNIDMGSGEKKNISNEDGTFELQGVPVGKVRATLFPRDFRDDGDYSFTQRNAVVKDDDPYELPPLTMVKRRLKKKEDEGWLGYKMKESDPGADWGDTNVEVGFVHPGGPADIAGLEAGDTVKSVDGHDVSGENSPRFYTLATVPIGTTVEFGLEGGKTVKITATKPP